MTSALGGVENGLAKHMLAATVTANINGIGLTFTADAAASAMGANRTAVAVLLINNVSIEVEK